jgi:hypothetical protein
MYFENKYAKWYYTTINNRLATAAAGYVEKHHIGGGDGQPFV